MVALNSSKFSVRLSMNSWSCQPFSQDDVHQAVEQGHVGAGSLADVQGGEIGDVNPARVGHHQLDAAPQDRLADFGAEDGVLFGSVGADDQHRLGVLYHVVHRVGHGARAIGCGQTGHSAGVSKTGAVIDGVRPQRLAGELVHQVVFFVQALG